MNQHQIYIKNNKQRVKRPKIRIKSKTQFLKKAKLFNQMFAWVNAWRNNESIVLLKNSSKKRYKILMHLKKNLFNQALTSHEAFTSLKKLKPVRKHSRDYFKEITKKATLWKNQQFTVYQKEVPLKARKDFFKTNIGLILLTAQRHSYSRPVIWRHLPQGSNNEGNLKQQKRKLPARYLYRIVTKNFMLGVKYRIGMQFLKEKWARRQKKQFIGHKVCTEHWTDYKHRPWLTFLLYKRALYAYNQTRITKQKRKWKKPPKAKPYLRKKVPSRTKHNKFYQRLLTYTAQATSVSKLRRKDKEKYTKQLLQKLIQPFYDIGSRKNFLKKWKRAKRKKSAHQTPIDFFLAKYECRLDVLVYRLNFAPNILWARRLIRQGAVFVTRLADMQPWIEGHKSLKIYAYPLKLKDPKKLYSQQSWNPQNKQTRYNFLIKPVYRPNYNVKSHEIIQYNPLGNLNKFKTNVLLNQKQIPRYLLTAGRSKIDWIGYRHRLTTKLLVGAPIKNDTVRSSTAFLLFPPQITDLSEKDRIKETFFRWTLV